MNDSNTLSDNVYLRHNMPLDVLPLASRPEDSQLVFLNEQNEKVLAQIMTLDGFASESIDEEVEHSAELARLDHKLNLLLDMVGIMISTNISLPEENDVTLYASHIDWVQNAPLECENGAWLDVSVWLRNDYPKPFHIYVQLEVQSKVEEGIKIRCKYHGFNEGITDQLEKIIFRHHRRVIAQSRNS